MSETLTTLVIDGLTGEISERDLTAEEIAQRKATQNQIKAQEAEAKAKAEARASALAKLAALGLSEAEIASL
jgi:hypothetical protein